MYLRRTVVIALLLALPGCTGMHLARVKKTASFDFNCPEEQITVQKLSSGALGVPGAQIGAKGCGQQGRYVLSRDAGWVRN
jgi:hypothetical protein